MYEILRFLPESFRWLLVKQKFEDTERVVKRIAKFNKLPFPRDVFDEVMKESSENKVIEPERKYTMIDMFRFRVLRKRSIIMAWVW